jgi:4-hydroxy-3-polyprenylbenzoate decarboxylase
MSYKNLQEFVKVLEAKRELIRIPVTVSSHLEITEIADRISKGKDGGKALLFEQVDGSAFPVLINAFGSAKRICLALETDTLDQLGNRLQEILAPEVPQGIGSKLRLLWRGLTLARYFTRTVKMTHPPCQEVIQRGQAVDLGQLPVLHCWPDDGGRFITLPVVFTKSLISNKRNAGLYRMQVFDKNTTGMHWHTHKDGAHFFREYERCGRRMEVAVAIGTDPAITYAATAPLPPGIDEMLLAGFIRRKAVEFVPAVTVDLNVPAEAEIVLEGYIDPQERRIEGPFGDHTGFYSLPDLYPVFHVTALTHRKNALYSTTVVGRPPMEDCFLALATERIFLPLLRTLMPEIRDYWLPWEGVFHNIAVVAIEKEYPRQARKVIHGLWGSGQMSFCKAIVVVDANGLHDKGLNLLKEILSRIDLATDVFTAEGILDALDHAAPCAFFGGKLGVDATRRIAGESPRPEQTLRRGIIDQSDTLLRLKALDDGFADLRIIFNDICLPLAILKISKNANKRGPFFRDLLLSSKAFSYGIAVFYDKDVNLDDDALLLWKIFNNVDPQRDIVIREKVAIIDATTKSDLDGHQRPWPEELINRPGIKQRVDARWQEYGLPDSATLIAAQSHG